MLGWIWSMWRQLQFDDLKHNLFHLKSIKRGMCQTVSFNSPPRADWSSQNVFPLLPVACWTSMCCQRKTTWARVDSSTCSTWQPHQQAPWHRPEQIFRESIKNPQQMDAHNESICSVFFYPAPRQSSTASSVCDFITHWHLPASQHPAEIELRQPGTTCKHQEKHHTLPFWWSKAWKVGQKWSNMMRKYICPTYNDTVLVYWFCLELKKSYRSSGT